MAAAAASRVCDVLQIVAVLCLCCCPVTCKKNKTPWLERIIHDMVNNYNKYAKMEGDPLTINFREFQEYLTVEMPKYIEGKDPDIVERTLASMDEDKDGELNHKEFFSFQRQFMITKYNAYNLLHS
ncbi:protein S100-A11-like isoform X2 [Hyla sarda]|uniref:protein S100-A11-like isoform X2 n=1 Tax=Hyla sarda TaxID=327740 RepID=UPI0024C3E4E9|nr:protein S100-A11-like isoform X2 [Hyla sarda]